MTAGARFRIPLLAFLGIAVLRWYLIGLLFLDKARRQTISTGFSLLQCRTDARAF